MKIVPVLAITNALALALAIFLLVQQGELKSQSGSRRSDSGETARLEARIASLERDLGQALAIRGIEPAPMGEPASHAAAKGSEEGPAAERETPALGSQPPEEAAGYDAPQEDYDPKEMDTFRRKVRKANELNVEEDQKVRIFDRIDELVKQNKIAPLSAKQKEGVASTVLVYRRKVPEVWRKVAEGNAMENVSREERGRIVRAEYEALRTEAQRSLEEFMPAVDAKTYLDETMRDQMRGGFGGGFGGGPPVQAPAPPSSSR
jgi:hypothetical protein